MVEAVCASGAADQLRTGTLDPLGTMTLGVGTLLWMAPEVFRGDQNYGGAVDIYSFGVILWEVAARRTPWDELGQHLSQVEFFNVLNTAMQTGRRPSIPKSVAVAHPNYVEVLQLCWAGDPDDRPPFSDITTALAMCLRRLA
jgi:serine/threonine protein kinase